MKNIFSLLILFLFSITTSFSQATRLSKANKFYEEGAYFKAIQIYEAILKTQKLPEATIKLADSYRLTNKSIAAEKLYSQIVKMKGSKPIDKFHYAQLLQTNGKCLDAKKWFTIYYNLDKSDDRALQLASSCDSLRFFRPDSSHIKVRKLSDINTQESEFCPILYGDGLVFISSRYSGGGSSRISARDGSPYLNMYYCEIDKNNQFGDIKTFHENLDSKLHDGPATFSKDFKKIYFTRNVRKKRTAKLRLFTADLENGEWKNIQPLALNDDKNSYGHPSLSPDGQTLYFTSDKTGQGGTDIFSVSKVGDKWGAVKNLGSKINTKGNEMFPYVNEDGILYFASNGHPGLGGLDIFRATFDSAGNCKNVLNMGAPVNSTYDDFALTGGMQKYTGYFSSNRPGGAGNDDIYQYQDLTEVKILKYNIEGNIVKTNKTNENEEPLQGATVSLLDETKKELEKKVTREDGKFDFNVESEKDYTLLIEKENYFTKRQNFSTVGKSKSAPVPKEDTIVKLKTNNEFTVKVKEIVLNQENVIPNIYYDYNKASIRLDAARELDKVVQLLMDNSKIVIEIGSHTDSRGNDNDNLKLSEKRALAVKDYLISKGMPADRITSRGYGKTRLIIPNAKTEKEHSQNRRTEFTVMQIRQ